MAICVALIMQIELLVLQLAPRDLLQLAPNKDFINTVS